MKYKKAAAFLLAGVLTGMTATAALPTGVAADGELVVLYTSDFEDGEDGWVGRGDDVVVAATDEYAHEGKQSLYVSGRTKIWNGTSLVSDSLRAGGTYTISAYVMYPNNEYNGQSFELNLQYDQGEAQSYPTVGRATAYTNSWTLLQGEVTIPTDAENISLYVQTAYTANPSEQDLMDFYIDDISFASLPDPEIQQDLTSLKAAYANYFKIGTGLMGSEVGIKPMDDLIAKHINSITFGNELKPDFVLDQAATLAYLEETGDQTNPQISLAKADRQLRYCAENGLPVRGHTLVWHSQTPDWFFKENFDANGDWVTKEVMLQRMENYIKNLMETLATDYPDVEFYAWDVVNEAMSENGTPRQAGSNNQTDGQSAWVSVFGDNSFIEYAFEYAREYAPEGCKLFYNDYNEYMTAKRDAIYDLVSDLYAKGLCDGVGMQSHLDMDFPSADTYAAALQKYASIGCEIQVTELDITTWDHTDAGLEKQATKYQDIFNSIKNAKDNGANITCVTIWGMIDPNSWRADRYPLLFDADYQAKPAFYSIVDGMEVSVSTLGGDVNLDNQLSIADVILLNQYLVRKKPLSADQLKNADMNKDRFVNALDSVSLKQALLAK